MGEWGMWGKLFFRFGFFLAMFSLTFWLLTSNQPDSSTLSLEYSIRIRLRQIRKELVASAAVRLTQERLRDFENDLEILWPEADSLLPPEPELGDIENYAPSTAVPTPFNFIEATKRPAPNPASPILKVLMDR
jgi:hypothetical protein